MLVIVVNSLQIKARELLKTSHLLVLIAETD